MASLFLRVQRFKVTPNADILGSSEWSSMHGTATPQTRHRNGRHVRRTSTKHLCIKHRINHLPSVCLTTPRHPGGALPNIASVPRFVGTAVLATMKIFRVSERNPEPLVTPRPLIPKPSCCEAWGGVWNRSLVCFSEDEVSEISQPEHQIPE